MGEMMQNCNFVEDEVLEKRAHQYVERLTGPLAPPVDDVEKELFKRHLVGYAQNYVVEHRCLAELSECDLKLRWLMALSFVRAGDASLIPELDDAIAELLLRGLVAN
jgi:hypothetical protein